MRMHVYLMSETSETTYDFISCDFNILLGCGEISGISIKIVYFKQNHTSKSINIENP